MTLTQEQAKALVGTIWVHTPKAVRRGAPNDRVFTVVGVVSPKYTAVYDIVGWGLLAWKLKLTTDGKVLHPDDRYQAHRDLTDQLLWVKDRTKSGAEPAAVFSPDSLYRRVTAEELKR